MSNPSDAAPVSGRVPLVAVVGNPNAGKTTLFNSLTGSQQKVANYAGVTVEKIEGPLKLEQGTVRCVDVPGLYSMQAVSEDERVAVEVILGRTESGPTELGRPDVLVCVVDAANLERNLFFTSQIADVGIPLVIALTMVDRLEGHGEKIDAARLSQELGAEVVRMVGHKGVGVDALKAAISRALANPQPPKADLAMPEPLLVKIDAVRERLARIGIDFSRGQVRRALLDPASDFHRYAEEFPEMRASFEEARAELVGAEAESAGAQVTARYQWAAQVQKAVVTRTTPVRKRSRTDKIDQILTHRVFGLLFFVGLMYLVFQSIYTFATPLMDLIEAGFEALQGIVSPALAGNPMLQSLVVDGIIAGVGGVLVFLPQILILFFFIAVLEGTGYLARAAFLMDRLLGWCGLNGRAFIPLLSSFACAIPGVMAARVMPDPKSRLATILVAPLMSCSARLPVYLLLIGAFIQPRFGAAWAGFALFAMHLLGLVVAIPIVWILNRGIFKGKRLPFLLELPPYQLPKWRDVWLAMYFRGKVFVGTAGTIIFAMSVLIWGLSYFPRLGPEGEARARAEYTARVPDASEESIDQHLQEAQLSQSVLGRFGKAIEPVFIPAGFDWRITTSILAAFPARETVVPSLGIIFSLGGDVDNESPDLQTALAQAKWPDGRPLFTEWTAIGLMVFFALCAQCMATLAAVKRETNSWKWALFMFVYMTTLAYLAAVGVHQLSLVFAA